MSLSSTSASSSSTFIPSPLPTSRATRTILVLGASYGGHRAIQSLVASLPASTAWRVVVLERNTHANHLYAFPRCAVVEGHEHKLFIPYHNMFRPAGYDASSRQGAPAHRLIHGCLTSLSRAAPSSRGRGVAHYIPLNENSACCRTLDEADKAEQLESIEFDYLVYALGSHLPPCINLWDQGKAVKKRPGKIDDDVKPLEPPMDAVVAAAKSKSACCGGSGCGVDLASVAEPPPLSKAKGSSSSSTSTTLPLPPCRGSKSEGVSWLQSAQRRIAEAKSVLVIGGGALGVQFASDIAAKYGTPTKPIDGEASPKRVTLLSGNQRLLPRFDRWMHDESKSSLEALGVEVLTGARADLKSVEQREDKGAEKEKVGVVRTTDGREVEAELVLFCTGQKPNTSYLCGLLDASQLDSVLDASSGMALVNRHLQLSLRSPSPSSEPETIPSLSHIFVIGDAADAFGALNAGHTAYAQAELATRNLLRLVANEERGRPEGDGEVDGWSEVDGKMEQYVAPKPAIKVSVGLDDAIYVNSTGHGRSKIPLDLNSTSMWTRRGLDAKGDLWQ